MTNVLTVEQERPWRPFLIPVLVLIVLILLSLPIIHLFRLDGPSAQQGQTRAQPLIAALERYHQAEGHYPQTLAALVPRYLETIPKPAWRYRYIYIVCPDTTAYTLTFRPGRHSGRQSTGATVARTAPGSMATVCRPTLTK